MKASRYPIFLFLCLMSFIVSAEVIVWTAKYQTFPESKRRYASSSEVAAGLAVQAAWGQYPCQMWTYGDESANSVLWNFNLGCSGSNSQTSYRHSTCPDGAEVDPIEGTCSIVECDPGYFDPFGDGNCVEMCPGATYNSATDSCDCDPVLAGGEWDGGSSTCVCPAGSYDLDGACVPDDHDSDGDGLPDSGEPPGCELLADCDGDGIPDGNEPPSCITNSDCDDDGLPDGDEPPGCMQDSDCDNDGIPDGDEPHPSCIRDIDCDDDGVPDPADPSPTDPDRDGDGIPDGDDPDPDDPDNPTPGGDTDTDGDGTPDPVDPDPNDPDNPGPPDPGDTGSGDDSGSGDETCLTGDFICPQFYQKAGCSCVPESLYTGSPNCSASASCTGDPIACAVAGYLRKQQCAMQETAADGGGAEPGPGDMPSETVSVGDAVGSLDTDLVSASGGCPAPRSIDALGESLQFEYDPVCEMAVMLEPVFLAFAGLWGLYVVGRAF